jgi:uncharacterized protein YjbI with pentapeptide repeats
LDAQEKKVLGAVYLEAPKKRCFQEGDVEKVLAELRELSSLLSRAAKDWEPRIDLDRQNHDLTGWDEVEANMSRMNLTNATLNNSRLIRVNLSDAILNGSQCMDSEFEGAIMTGAQMIGTNFARSTLSGANLSSCRAIIAANFSETDLRDSDFTAAIIETSDFSDADMGHADLARAKFREVNLAGSSFRGALLHHTTFDSCQWDDDSDLTNCSITRSSYRTLPEDIAKKFQKTFKFID